MAISRDVIDAVMATWQMMMITFKVLHIRVVDHGNMIGLFRREVCVLMIYIRDVSLPPI